MPGLSKIGNLRGKIVKITILSKYSKVLKFNYLANSKLINSIQMAEILFKKKMFLPLVKVDIT